MRRISRYLSFTVPALLCLIFFSACNTGTNPVPAPAPGKTALAAPQNVRINEANFTLMWDPVQNAAEYSVQIEYGNKTIRYGVTSTMCPLDEIATAEGVHQISVQAVAGQNDSSFSNSELSSAIDCEPADYVFEYDSAPEARFNYSRAVTGSGGLVISGLTPYGQTLPSIIIPGAIKGVTVITIGSSAFAGNGVLVSVVIAATVTQVEDNAFRGCEQLATVAFNKPAGTSGGETATGLGDGVFAGCGVLVNIIVPDGSADAYADIIGEKAPDVAEKVIEAADSVPVSAVTLFPNTLELTLESGRTVTSRLGVQVEPAGATNRAVTWKSSNPNVAGVDNNGLVTAVGQGTTTITVTTVDGGKTATCAVTVNGASVPVTGVTIDESELSLDIGDSAPLTAVVAPPDATNINRLWSSSDSSVAKVDNNGNVTAIKAGTATITVTTVDGGKTATCTVTVKSPDPEVIAVTGVSVEPDELTFEKAGDYVGLNFTVEPSNATNPAVTWRSGNPDVASVDNSGIITAVGPGRTTITVTTVNGGKTASCLVTVEGVSNPGQYTVTIELVAGSDKQVVKPGPYTYTEGGSLTIPLESDYTLYEWRLDGILKQGDIILTGLATGTYEIKVIAADINGVPYSNDLEVTVKEGENQGSDGEYNVSIELSPIYDIRIVDKFSSSSEITQGQDYNIEMVNDFTLYEWYLNKVSQEVVGNSIVITAPTVGTYEIKVIAYDRNDIPYTNELTLTVSQ